MKLCRPDLPVPRGRVALLVPRWTDASDPDVQGTPFRSLLVGGALLAAGYEVLFFDQEHDLDRHDRFAEFLDLLHGSVAAVIWMNEMYPFNQTDNAHRLSERIHARFPELPVVVGGEFVTICPPGFFDFEHGIDYFLRGYGEETAVRLVEHLQAGTEPRDVPGLVYTAPDGTRHDRPAERKAFLRREWLALYDQLDLSGYIQRGGVLGNDQPTLALVAGRGCVKGCGFCAWSNHRARVLDAEVYFELIAKLRARYGVKQFHIAELDFFTWPKRALELAERLRRECPDVVWFALGSPVDLVRISDADWAALYAGGLRKVEIGSESASARLLGRIGKQHQPEDIYRCSERMVRHGIRPMNNFLFGFPGETRVDRAASLAMIHRLFELSPELCHFTYRYYQPVWGTPLGDEAIAAIPEPSTRLDHWLAERHRYHQQGARALHWLPAADEREIKDLINFQLPLATSQYPIESRWRRRVYFELRARARRVTGRARQLTAFDRWVYRRLLDARLDQTYIP